MTAHDDRLLDDVAVYALGALAADDAARVREHLTHCATCRAEYLALLGVVGAVARSAEAPAGGAAAAGPSPLLKSRIMKRVRSESRAPADGAARADVAKIRAVRPIVWPAYLVAAACFAIALVTSIFDISLNEQVKQSQVQVAALAQRATTLSHDVQQQNVMVADLLSNDSVRYPVAGGEVVKHADRLYIAMRALPAPPKGKVYQAWTLKPGATRMTPSVTFLPNRSGIAVVPIPASAKNVVAVAVSVEPDGGSKQPTSTPTFLVKLG